MRWILGLSWFSTLGNQTHNLQESEDWRGYSPGSQTQRDHAVTAPKHQTDQELTGRAIGLGGFYSLQCLRTVVWAIYHP